MIYNNTAQNYGGGIYFLGSGNQFNITGTTNITSNKCDLYYGGGIF